MNPRWIAAGLCIGAAFQACAIAATPTLGATDLFHFEPRRHANHTLELAIVYGADAATTPSLEVGYAALRVEIPQSGFHLQSVRVAPEYAISDASPTVTIGVHERAGFIAAPLASRRPRVLRPGSEVALLRIATTASGALPMPKLMADPDGAGIRAADGRLLVPPGEVLVVWDPVFPSGK